VPFFPWDTDIGQDCRVPTPANQTKAKRQLTAKELRAVRRKRLDREKQLRKAQGLRPIWSLPAGQPVRRNYIITLLLCIVLGAGIAHRVWRAGAPLPGAIFLGAVVWLLVTSFVAWSFRKNWPY
jgi:hypothetical protein